MKKDSILLMESFFLPGCRERLYKTYVAIKKRKQEEAVQNIVEQRQWLELLLDRKLDIQGKEDYTELVDRILKESKPLINRLQTIRLRAKEIKVKKAGK